MDCQLPTSWSLIKSSGIVEEDQKCNLSRDVAKAEVFSFRQASKGRCTLMFAKRPQLVPHRKQLC